MKKYIFTKLLTILILTTSSHGVSAQEKLNVKFRARGLFDLGYFDLKQYNDKVHLYITDLRVGAKATYGDLSFKIDVGLSGDKISIKDMYLDYQFKSSRLVLGNAYEPFSMDVFISSPDFRFNTSSSAAQAIGTGRRFGLTYHLYRNQGSV